MTWMRAAGLHELRSGAAKCVTVGGRRIALVSVDGTLYALDDECPHEVGGSLSRGTVDPLSVWCPLHGARFALTTGETLEPPEGESMTPPVDRGVRTYQVGVIGDAIYLDL
jgi:nitrite reductase/ring-hydroxylating ferredoxin subunit